jgi:MFS family permease
VAEAPVATAGTAPEPWPSPARAWYGVAVFTLVLTFNAIDRQIMNLLVEPIKHDLGISDTQMSLLLGFSYAVFSAIAGIPIARLADVKSRRLIIAIGVIGWSTMTAACGLAQNYWQLFLARVGVGVGDACNAPATFSILSDTFPKDKLHQATSVISIGFLTGTGISLIVGATVIQLVAGTPTVLLPLFGEIRSWQLVFILVGLPGLLLALLLTTVEEPKRRGLMGGTAEKPEALPLLEILRFLHSEWKTYGPIFLTLAFRAMLGFGIIVWLPSFFIRTYGWTPSQIGYSQGLILLVVAPAGLVFGGFLAGWLLKRGYRDANLRVVMIASMAIAPCAMVFPLLPDPHWALGVYALYTFLAYLSPGPQNAALQIITPNQMRAQITAMFILIFNLVGFGVGPTFIAMFTDYVLGDESYLRYSLALGGVVLAPLAALVTWFGLKPYTESLHRAEMRA